MGKGRYKSVNDVMLSEQQLKWPRAKLDREKSPKQEVAISSTIIQHCSLISVQLMCPIEGAVKSVNSIKDPCVCQEKFKIISFRVYHSASGVDSIQER